MSDPGPRMRSVSRFRWAPGSNGVMAPPLVEFEAFFAEAEPVLRASLVARYGPEVGREATAEALVWAYEHWAKAQAMANPLGYLYRVGQTHARRFRRQQRWLPGRSTVDREPSLELDLDLEQALARLPEKQRLAIVLRYSLDFSLNSTAQFLGVSCSTAQTHIRRGLQQLRDLLGSSHDLVR